MNDVVIDTNIWMHAQDRKSQFYADATKFVGEMGKAATLLCLDAKAVKGGSLVGSKILGEYERKFFSSAAPAGPSAILAAILQNSRISVVRLSDAEAKVRNWAKQNITKKSDRPFLITAALSESRTLVTHDRADFPKRKCKRIKKELKVDVRGAAEAVGFLPP